MAKIPKIIIAKITHNGLISKVTYRKPIPSAKRLIKKSRRV